MTMEKFECKLVEKAVYVRETSRGTCELYWDYLDCDNVVLGVRRTSMPVSFERETDWGEIVTALGWRDTAVNEYCDVLRELAPDLAAALQDNDGRDWCAPVWDLLSWGHDGDELSGYDEDVTATDGRDYNLCAAVTVQVYV